MFRKKMLGIVSWLAIIAWVISACGSAQAPRGEAGETAAQPTPVEGHEAEIAELKPVSLAAGEKLRVIATTNIISDIVSQVGGEVIDLTQLLPIGIDPHTYTATAQDVVAVIDTHVIFANGVNLELEFLPDLMQHTDAPVVYVSQGVELQEFGAEDTHEQEGFDPHIWTTPVNAILFVHTIERTLSALDPANAKAYEANAQKYQAELEALDEWVKEQIATIPAENRKLVTDHETFGYYASHYGLEKFGAVIPAFSTGAEPSAQELAALEDTIREHGVRAVFVGTTVNPSLAQQLAADTGIKLISLYTGSLGPAGSHAETYIDYIRYNTAAIVEGLR